MEKRKSKAMTETRLLQGHQLEWQEKQQKSMESSWPQERESLYW